MYYQRSIFSSSASRLSHGKKVVDEHFSLTKLTLLPSNICYNQVAFPPPFPLRVCVAPQLRVRVEREQEEAPQHGEDGPRELR